MARMRVRYFVPGGQAESFETAARSMTIGSGQGCDLRLSGLGPLECTIYLSEQGYYATNEGGRLSINGVEGPGFVRANDVLRLGDTMALRFDIVADAPPPAPAGRPLPAGRASAAAPAQPVRLGARPARHGDGSPAR
ncbi:MAG: hypothetical protein GXP47_03760, partial [Acidobacteria bacterium]|nr:hypothetical protein [Acidobacteriota bacterium]